MNLSKHLVLYRFLLSQFGYENHEQMRADYADKRGGYDAGGRSYFAGTLLGNKNRKIEETILLQYDEAIKGYEEELVKHRSEPWLSLKYYQYFAILFTEHFLDQLSNSPQLLLEALNEYKSRQKDFESISAYTAGDLKKLAYWMATGSGKTLIMHINYRQINKYFSDWENIILLTPNEGLSQQHYSELQLSGIPAKLYSGNEESLKTGKGEVLIIEITKLTRDKEGEGVSVDVDYFSESKNLVFIDEGHKGQRTEERAWKKLREYLTRGEQSFTFEYSATFGQIITSTNSDLLDEYGKAIIYDYSYQYFYEDGYGKDFSVFNIEAAENGYSERQTQLLLTASLLGYYEQLQLFEEHEAALKQYNIEKPLWVFIGSKVIGKKTGKTDEAKSGKLTGDEKATVSDVSLVIQFFDRILSAPAELESDIQTILRGESEFVKGGDDIFKGKFESLRINIPSAEQILHKVFHGAGSLESYNIKKAEGEIGLKTVSGQDYFGVINIGDVSSFAKKLEEDTAGKLLIEDDHFSSSLFQSLSQKFSNINILIGSKKFIEGWNSWRVSSMGLMNMGRGEGAQIIQLFGRGVRLKGKEFSLKREEHTAAYFVKALQTISIFGLNANYMSSFLNAIDKETERLTEYEIKINFNKETEWENKILTFKAEATEYFKNMSIALELKPAILKRVQIDLRPKISVASSGFNGQVAESDEGYISGISPLHEYGSFIDYNKLYLALNRYKIVKGFTNLVINTKALKAIVDAQHNIVTLKSQFNIGEALNGKIQTIAELYLKDYIGKFYTDKEKDYLTKNLGFDYLSKEKYPEVFPEKNTIIVKVPEKKASEIETLLEEINNFYTGKVTEIPTIHFDKHLYSPIATYKKGKEYIKTIPVKLNRGETAFVEHLRDYLTANRQFADKEVFVLRNLSKRGVGFFIESSSFYPDFIIWVVTPEKQLIYFVDPKGILMMGNFKNDKIIFCNETIQEINEAISKKVKEKELSQRIELKAFILSVTPYEEVRASWESSSTTKEEFEAKNILFIDSLGDSDKRYLAKMFGNI